MIDGKLRLTTRRQDASEVAAETRLQLLKLNEQQRELLAAIKKSGDKKKDFWDILPGVTGFLATVVVGSVGLYFTHLYNDNQTSVAELTTLEKFIGDLTGSDSKKQLLSVRMIRTLGDTEFATEIAADVGTPGAITELARIAANGSSKDRALALNAIYSIDPHSTITELAKLAASGAPQDRAVATQVINSLNAQGVDELAKIATTGSQGDKQVATQAFASLAARGVDVSGFQGTIDWHAVASDHVVFGVARATEGTRLTDDHFRLNWDEMKAAGLIRGAYHVFRPKEDGAAQADAFLAQTKPTLDDLPPMLDVEITDGVTDEVLTDQVLAWLKRVADETKRTPVVYSFPSFLAHHTLLANALTAYPIWVAAYTESVAPTPPGWSHWTFWEYTSAGQIKGIQGPVDLNAFDGSIDDLKKFINPNYATFGGGGSTW